MICLRYMESLYVEAGGDGLDIDRPMRIDGTLHPALTAVRDLPESEEVSDDV